ncbi:MAG TPA: hemerythrin domain-containing protein [Polyangiaceae bacterium]
MPDLFGRATVVVREHGDLRQQVDWLRELCVRIVDDQAPAELAPGVALTRFLEQLRGHFATEESPEYFGALAEGSPRLIRRLDQLRAEHAQMLTTLESLSALAAESPEPLGLAIGLGQFLDRLAAHEKQETLILQEYFLWDGIELQLGADDDPLQ